MKSLNGIIKSLAIAALLLACGVAKADTLKTYDVTGTLSSGGALSGDFTLDLTTSTVVSTDLTADGVEFTNCPGGPAGKCVLYNNLFGGTADGFGVSSDSGWPYLNIIWSAVDLTNMPDVLTLVNTTLCVDCGPNGEFKSGAYFDNLVSGTAVDPPVTNTPENSSLTTLLAGLAGLVAFAAWQSRRKLAVSAV